MFVKKGDKVRVIAGKDKGVEALVVAALPKVNKVVVEGVNVVKRHQKPNPMRGIEGGIVSKEMPLDVSNVAILNPETNKADRVGIKLVENEGKIKRVRFFKSNGSVIGAVVVVTTVTVGVGETFWISIVFSISTIFLGLPTNTGANLLK